MDALTILGSHLRLRRRMSAAFVLVLACGLLGGCGQRGPLYLPQPPAAPAR